MLRESATRGTRVVESPFLRCRTRILLVGVALGGWTGALAVDVPPIRYTGELVTTLRGTFPDEGEESYLLGSTARFGAGTYLWQPWFATVDGGLSLSQFQTFAATESSSLLTSGDLRLNVFPRSRFPFSAFVSLTDSRSEFESTTVRERETQQLRFGVSQRYQPLGGNSTYYASLQRVQSSGTDDSFGQTSHFADLQMTYRLDKHNIAAGLNIEQTSQDNPDADFLDVVATVRHGWRPSDTLTIDNFASVTDTSTDSGFADLRTTEMLLSSFAAWNPKDSKLSVTGNARYIATRSDTSGSAGTRQSASANVTARYRWSPALRFTGSLGARYTGGDTATSQSLSASYSPLSLSLLGFQYSYSANTSASNRTASDGGSRSFNAGFSHGLNRVFPLRESGAMTLSTSVNQSINFSANSSSDSSTAVTHSASIGLFRSGAQNSTRLLLSAQDSRSFGGGDLEVQSANLQLTHDARFGRFSSMVASANVAWTRSVVASGDARSFPSSSLTMSYQHSRFLGVRRLRFSSGLSVTSDTLTFVGLGDEDLREVEFENELAYSIGRVDARLEATITESNGRLNSFVFFRLSRRFAGVY